LPETVEAPPWAAQSLGWGPGVTPAADRLSRPRWYRGRDCYDLDVSASVSSLPTRHSAGRIVHSDAYDALASLPPRTVDLLCTSPPYWGHRDYGQEHNEQILDAWRTDADDTKTCPPYPWYRANGGVLGLEPYPEWYVAHLVEIIGRAGRALKTGGNVWVNLGDTYFGRWSSVRPRGRQGLGGASRARRRTPSGGWLHDKQLLMLPARFAIAMQDAGWILRNDLIWSKPHVPPRPERDRLRLSHEHFFHFVQRTKGARPTYFYDRERAEEGALDVVSVQPNYGVTRHPATFPRALIVPRIASSSPPGGLVCDPFCGSGITLACAVELGRDAIGFDLSRAYVGVAKAYLESLNALEIT
jgi:site-specific DNA-methyltransferase (cytosine-N4-specific)